MKTEGFLKRLKNSGWEYDSPLKAIEAYANQKVLEALEEDLKKLSDCYKVHAGDNPKKEVCTVLHTLIMEKQEQIRVVKRNKYKI